MRDPAGGLGTKQFKMAERLASQTLQRFAELEELAQEIMEDKQQIIELDKQRNTNREALRILKKEDKRGLSGASSSKPWVCFGNMFIKLPSSNVQAMLQQDQKNLEEEISRLRKDLKPKVSKLHELEGLPEVKGFDLTALTKDDLKSLEP